MDDDQGAAGVALLSPLCAAVGLRREAPQHGREQPFRLSLQRSEPARDRRRRHDGQVLPHEADHGADRVRIGGQRYRARAASTACPSSTANAACVLSQASISGSALALIPAVRNARTIRSSRGGGTAVGFADRHREPAGHEAGRAVPDHVAVHRASVRGEAEQHPLVADHRALANPPRTRTRVRDPQPGPNPI